MISGRLIIRPRWLERIEQFGLPLFCLLGIWYVIMLWTGLDFDNSNEAFIGYGVLPIVIVVLIIVFCKKLQETRLHRITTGLGKIENKKMAELFIKEEGYESVRGNKDFVIAIIPMDFTNYPYQINILLAEGFVCLCVLRLNSRVRLPSFFEARSIRKDLEGFVHDFRH